MKLLGWMHRKLMQNSIEPTKNSTIGNHSTGFSAETMFDDRNYYMEPTKILPRSNAKSQKNSNIFEAKSVEELFQEESFEPFDFLAIGTFGMELPNTEPPTPTLPVTFENMTNQQTEITENDLKLINDELEKFLEAEEKEIANDTSERSSYASIITLSNKPVEGDAFEGHMSKVACPLQNYFFATPIELAATNKEVKKEKTSLEDLFKENNICLDDPTRKCDGAEQQPRKRNIAHFIKRAVKLPSSSNSPKTSKDEATGSVSIKKKLIKAVKMFHRKVHPEDMSEKNDRMKMEKKKSISHADAFQNRGYNKNKMVSQAPSKQSEKNPISLSSNGIYNGSSTINGGHWIKTDSDYLVLEL